MNEFRNGLKNVLLRVDKRPRHEVVREVARILKVAETLGYRTGSREMYGGGTSLTIYEPKVGYAVAEITCYDAGKGPMVHAHITEEQWFDDPTFEFSELPSFNPELEAELRNEEALYGYELPRPWVLHQ